ncbi:MAG: hypothetical protein ABW133_21965 [Polyangiaceae bacterium]
MKKQLIALGLCLVTFPIATASADDTKGSQVASTDPVGGANVPADPSAPPDPSANTPAAPQGAAAADEAPSDCVFGIAVWCFSRTSRPATLPETKWRVEGNVGYKFSNIYYGHEIRGCDAAGCTLDFSGPSFAFGAFYNVKGNPHTDDYIDLGLAVSYMPIISEIANNRSGFDREYGRVDPGDGSLAYVPVRVAMRRPSFLYVIKSKYLVSEFGAGLAFPVSSGAGRSFTGADSVKATVGGRLGFEIPVAGVFRAGLAGNWTVVWYAGLWDASFQTSYGLHFADLM